MSVDWSFFFERVKLLFTLILKRITRLQRLKMYAFRFIVCTTNSMFINRTPGLRT